MNPVLRLIYEFLKLVTKTALNLFFSRIDTLNKGVFKQVHGPLILVSNHPNTLIDALLVASRAKQPVYFLGHAGLFKHPFTNWFFSTFYTICIERPEDVGGRPINNDESFRKSIDHLKRGGLIFIAPEGGSEMERSIRRIKTGTARIALAAEKEAGYKLGVKILPVGLTYEAPPYFQSSVTANAGQPISISDFQEENENNHRETVRKITANIEQSIKALTVNAEQEIEPVLHIYEAWLKAQQIIGKEAFQRGKEFVEKLRSLPSEALGEYLDHQKQLTAILESFHFPINKTTSLLGMEKAGPIKWLYFILGFPLFLFGFINNLIPASIPVLILKRVDLFIGYHSTVKIVLGIFLFPLFYALQTSVVLSLTGSWLIALIYLLSLLPLGYFAWYYMEGIRANRILNQLNAKRPEWKDHWNWFDQQFKYLI